MRGTFDNTSIDDRRLRPSHGYRAVHVVVSLHGRLVEVQVRTREQHLWAELSEKLADVVDPALKYGGGPAETRDTLMEYSDLLAQVEQLETKNLRSRADLVSKELHFKRLSALDPDKPRTQRVLEDLRQSQDSSEAATQRVKKSLAGLLVDYYNELTERDS